MMHLLQMDTSKMLTSLPLQIQNTWQVTLPELPLQCPYLLYCNFLWFVYLHCTFWPPLLMLHFRPTFVFKLLIPLPPILYLLPLPPHNCLLILAILLRPLLPLSPQTPSVFFNEMLAVFEPGALNCFTFFHPIPFTLSVFRNPILTYFPFSDPWILWSAF